VKNTDVVKLTEKLENRDKKKIKHCYLSSEIMKLNQKKGKRKTLINYNILS
jgi:hypothetical protein